MHELLSTLCESLEQESISYCLMRDAERLDRLRDNEEIDLLVHPGHFARMCELLTGLGFLGLSSWGYAPHHFFVAYNRDSDGWLKLDVVTEVAFGRPIHALRTQLAANCLRNRHHHGLVFGLAPEDELVTLLLHCVLDKGDFAPAHSQRLKALCCQVTKMSYLSTLMTTYWSPMMTWPRLAALVEAEDWKTLLAGRAAVAAYLAGRDRLGTIARQIGYRALRKLNRWTGWLRPQTLTVALLAPDGAGKSTLAQAIQASFYFPVKSVYMGLYQKGARKAGRRALGFGLAGQMITQWWRYLTARYYQTRGRLVIFDRYTFDALLPPRYKLNWLGQVRRWLLAHACPAPDLVLVLDVPGEVLYARKGEHSAAILEQERQQYLALRPHLPQMVVVDATRDIEHVRREAMTVIWRGYTARLSRT